MDKPFDEFFVDKSHENEEINYLIQLDKAYDEGKPIINDTNYDIVKEGIREKYPNHEYFQTVGYEVIGDKVKLPFILGSLRKTKHDGSCEKWLSKQLGAAIVLSLKQDGISVYVEYRKGKVHFAATRGNGEWGKDITEKAKIFCPDLKIRKDFKIRGEAVMVNDDHLKLGFKNRRNGAAGLINKSTHENAHYLKFIAYELIEAPEEFGTNTEGERMFVLDSLLTVTPFRIISNECPEEYLRDVYIKEKEKSISDVDGLVLTRNQSEREDVKYPESKVAFKVNESAVITTVIEAELNVGRTGAVTPVLIIDPVEINGSTISRVTAHNMKNFFDNKLFAGAKIGIIKSGDVIPKIAEVIEGSDLDYCVPNCPSCGSDLTWSNTKTDLICYARACHEKNIKQTEFFLTEHGVEHITTKTLVKIGVEHTFQLYNLDFDTMIQCEGIGESKAKQILEEIKKTVNTTPDKLISSCGISGVGTEAARLILANFKFDEIFRLTEDQLLDINGIGEIIASTFCENQLYIHSIYTMLMDNGLKFTVNTESAISGKSIVLTGNGPIQRNELITAIESQGGFYKKSVSKKVDILVTDSPSGDSGKNKKARQYGTEIMPYEMLIEMLGIQ